MKVSLYCKRCDEVTEQEHMERRLCICTCGQENYLGGRKRKDCCRALVELKADKKVYGAVEFDAAELNAPLHVKKARTLKLVKQEMADLKKAASQLMRRKPASRRGRQPALTMQQAEEVKRLGHAKLGAVAIGLRFGVTAQVIRRVLTGKGAYNGNRA